MAHALRQDQLLTADEFFLFTEDRPDGEKWELLDGVALLSPTPTDYHQLIVANVSAFLHVLSDERDADWMVLPGLGVLVAGVPANVPAPDVLVMPRRLSGSHACTDPIVLFEILSPGSRRRDLRFKRDLYAKVASVRHYAVLAQDRMHVTLFDRDAGWAPRMIDEPGAALALPAIDATMPLRTIYRRTGLDASSAGGRP